MRVSSLGCGRSTAREALSISSPNPMLRSLAHNFIIATPAHGPVCVFRRGSNLLADASTVFNMHELAITSGFAAAYRLGADFPHLGDEKCLRLFRLYLCLSHAARLVESLCLL